MSALFNRNFILLWQGQFVSQVGNQAYLIALMFWLLEHTGSVALMGMVLMTSSLPGVLLGPLAGAFVDRHSRKAIIVGSDLARGLAVAVLAITMVTSDSTELIIATLFVVAVVNGVAAAVFNPAVGAAIPDLVPPTSLRGANSLNQMSVQAASFLGLAAGGTLYALFGPVVLFTTDAISFLLSGLSEFFIRLPQKKSTESRAGLAGY
ncbi:MAG: MFS transporter, partial [Gemmatimonadetes bacterium]|nr:MFS transporter [Gemmatimonadota bacterium]